MTSCNVHANYLVFVLMCIFAACLTLVALVCLGWLAVKLRALQAKARLILGNEQAMPYAGLRFRGTSGGRWSGQPGGEWPDEAGNVVNLGNVGHLKDQRNQGVVK